MVLAALFTLDPLGLKEDISTPTPPPALNVLAKFEHVWYISSIESFVSKT